MAPPILLVLSAASLLPASGCWQGQDAPLTAVPTQITLPAADVDVPVAIVDNHIFVDVTVNGGGPYKFLLDTGAALSQISPNVSAQFPDNLLNSFITLFGPLGATSQFQLFRIDSLGIGGMDFQNCSAAVQNVAASFPDAPFTVEGIAGIGLFHDLALTLNYPGEKIRVQTGVLPAVDNCHILPLTGGDLDRGVYLLPQLPMTVQGQTVLVNLDSGNNGFLILPDSFANLPFAAPPTQITTLTVNGPTPFLRGVLNGSVTMGCTQFDDPTLLIGGSLTSLGGAAMKPYVVTLDQRSKSVRFSQP